MDASPLAVCMVAGGGGSGGSRVHQVVVPFTHQNAIVSRTTKYLVTTAVYRGASVASACTDGEVGVILTYVEVFIYTTLLLHARAHGAW